MRNICALIRLHSVKIEPVIIYASRVVLKRRLKMAGKPSPHGEQFLQRIFLQRRILFEKVVQIIDVCLEMAVVVKTHCLLIDKRFKCVISVWEGRVDKRIIVIHDDFLKFFLTVYERTAAYVTHDKAAGLTCHEV